MFSLAYADDIGLASRNYMVMHGLLEIVNLHSATRINALRPLVMSALNPNAQRPGVLFDGEPLEEFDRFKFLD